MGYAGERDIVVQYRDITTLKAEASDVVHDIVATL
jgi:hypothetical protein